MERLKDHKELFESITGFINEREFFWLNDLRIRLGCTNADNYDIRNKAVTTAIGKLKKADKIQCCEVRKGYRQYHVKEIIILEDVMPRQ